MSMMLHCGANAATMEEVEHVVTPSPTDTWHPIPHHLLIQRTVAALTETGWNIKKAEFGLWGDEGEMMFALMNLTNGHQHDDYGVSIGLRNSHNKRFCAGLAMGSNVFICDNLAFSAEVVFARKHTSRIMADLERLVFETVGKMAEAKRLQDERIAAYKLVAFTNAVVHDILIRSVDAKVMANSYIAKVLQEWREPRHEAFEPRTAWSLFNSFTEVFKAIHPLDLGPRTTRLYGLMDSVVDATGPEVDPNEIVVEEEIAN